MRPVCAKTIPSRGRDLTGEPCQGPSRSALERSWDLTGSLVASWCRVGRLFRAPGRGSSSDRTTDAGVAGRGDGSARARIPNTAAGALGSRRRSRTRPRCTPDAGAEMLPPTEPARANRVDAGAVGSRISRGQGVPPAQATCDEVDECDLPTHTRRSRCRSGAPPAWNTSTTCGEACSPNWTSRLQRRCQYAQLSSGGSRNSHPYIWQPPKLRTTVSRSSRPSGTTSASSSFHHPFRSDAATLLTPSSVTITGVLAGAGPSAGRLNTLRSSDARRAWTSRLSPNQVASFNATFRPSLSVSPTGSHSTRPSSPAMLNAVIPFHLLAPRG